VLGSATEDDKAYVTDQKAQEYLDSFGNVERKDFKLMYQAAGSDALDLLDRIL
jgi:hypothetical protein